MVEIDKYSGHVDILIRFSHFIVILLKAKSFSHINKNFEPKKLNFNLSDNSDNNDNNSKDIHYLESMKIDNAAKNKQAIYKFSFSLDIILLPYQNSCGS